MNAIVKLKPSSRSLLLDVAKSALQRSKGNIAIAASQIRAIADRDPALKQELLDPYYEQAIMRLLRRIRPPLTPQPIAAAPARVAETTGIEQLAKANLTDYLNDYRLSTGKMLGNAKRYDLIQEARYRREAMLSQAAHYRFVSRLCEYLRDDNLVRDQFDNGRLAVLMREAEEQKTAL